MHYFIDKRNSFSVQLLKWYSFNRRDLPWRNTTDPYKIWLSEIILQQTRVIQGLAYYQKFITNYPTIDKLANASEEEVLKNWQGLGYYSRARNLHSTAKFIQRNLNGKFPKHFESIKSLKGVGDYTASAIASFAYNLPYAVVDGNVYRVLARIFGIKTPIDSVKGKKEFALLAQQLLNTRQAGEYNQAIMEFGAIQCTAQNPNCNVCVFQPKCEAFYTDKIDFLPFKAKKVKQKKRYFHYFIFEDDTNIMVHKRNQKDIWQNLYDFPLIEDTKALSFNKLKQHNKFKEWTKGVKLSPPIESESRKHILSHQVLIAKFFHFSYSSVKIIQNFGFKDIKKSKLKNYPIPKLIENYLNEETNLLSLF